MNRGCGGSDALRGLGARRGDGAETAPALGRREVVGGLVAVLPLLLAERAGAAPARIPPVPPPAIRFDVLREGAVIGEHLVDFARLDGGYSVQTRIEIAVRILGVKVFEFRHKSTEVWKKDRLVTFESKTRDDDSEFFVDGRATASGFEMTNRKGVETAPADIMVASYWTPEIARQTLLIDPQRGRVKPQQLVATDTLAVPVAGASVNTTRYRLTGITNGWVAYDDRGRWLAAELQKKGSDILYRQQG